MLHITATTAMKKPHAAPIRCVLAVRRMPCCANSQMRADPHLELIPDHPRNHRLCAIPSSCAVRPIPRQDQLCQEEQQRGGSDAAGHTHQNDRYDMDGCQQAERAGEAAGGRGMRGAASCACVLGLHMPSNANSLQSMPPCIVCHAAYPLPTHATAARAGLLLPQRPVWISHPATADVREVFNQWRGFHQV